MSEDYSLITGSKCCKSLCAGMWYSGSNDNDDPADSGMLLLRSAGNLKAASNLVFSLLPVLVVHVDGISRNCFVQVDVSILVLQRRVEGAGDRGRRGVEGNGGTARRK